MGWTHEATRYILRGELILAFGSLPAVRAKIAECGSGRPSGAVLAFGDRGRYVLLDFGDGRRRAVGGGAGGAPRRAAASRRLDRRGMGGRPYALYRRTNRPGRGRQRERRAASQSAAGLEVRGEARSTSASHGLNAEQVGAPGHGFAGSVRARRLEHPGISSAYDRAADC